MGATRHEELHLAHEAAGWSGGGLGWRRKHVLCCVCFYVFKRKMETFLEKQRFRICSPLKVPFPNNHSRFVDPTI